MSDITWVYDVEEFLPFCGACGSAMSRGKAPNGYDRRTGLPLAERDVSFCPNYSSTDTGHDFYAVKPRPELPPADWSLIGTVSKPW